MNEAASRVLAALLKIPPIPVVAMPPSPFDPGDKVAPRLCVGAAMADALDR
jgi:hypothetical protein